MPNPKMAQRSNIVIVSKRQKKAQQDLASAGYLLVDVTSTSPDPTFRRFSPFYPHGNIPIPGTSNTTTSQSVEGLWQGLKVFENEDIDPKKFAVTNMRNIKRPAGNKRGRVIGHKYGDSIIDYVTSRKLIYIPAYMYVLENHLQVEMLFLTNLLKEGNKLALIDYETNEDPEDTRKPMSHAALIASSLNSP